MLSDLILDLPKCPNKVKKWISHCIFKSCTEGFEFGFGLEFTYLTAVGVPKVLILTSHILYPIIVTP